MVIIKLYSLVYGIVSSESYDDWHWFLSNVRRVTGTRNLTIVSDPHPNIIRSVVEIFGSQNQAYCYWHLKENFGNYISKVMSRVKRSSKEEALKLLDGVAYSGIEKDYNDAMHELKNYKELWKWVLDNDPEHWSMFKCIPKRWDQITTNLVESFNFWV